MNKRDTRIARQAQSGENLTATWIDEDTVKLEVNGKSFTVTTHTDFTATDKDILEELDTQLSLCGECDDPQIRQLKFCKVRKHIQAALNAAYHPATLNRTFSRSGM